MPVWFVVQTYFPVDLPFLLWLFMLSAVYTVCAVGRSAWRSASKWQLYSAASVFACLLAGIEAGVGLTGFVQAGVVLAVVLRAMFIAKQELAAAFYMNKYLSSAVVYFVSSLLFPVFGVLAPYVPWVYALGIVSLVLVVFKTNQDTLLKETQGASRMAFSLRTLGNNRLLTLLFLAAVIVLGLLPVPYHPSAVALGVMRFIWWGLYWLNPAPSSPGQQQQLNPYNWKDDLPPNDPAAWALMSQEWLPYILISVAGLASIVLVIWLFRYRLRMWTRLKEWLAARFGRDDLVRSGYVDEQKRLINWGDWTRERKKQLREWATRRKSSESEPHWGEIGITANEFDALITVGLDACVPHPRPTQHLVRS